jgi:hypothetical protein
MLRGVLVRLAAFGLASLVSSTATAGQTIATGAWEYEAPAGWSIDRNSEPAQSVGPLKELVQFSTYHLPSVSEGGKALAIRTEVESNGLKAIEESSTQDGFKVTLPLKTFKPAPELTVHELVSVSKNGESVLAQFLIVGPHAVVLITYQARAPASSLKDVRQAVHKMKWAA